MKHTTPEQIAQIIRDTGQPVAVQVRNTKEHAYDGFHQELHVGDTVIVAVSRWTGDYILYKGIVRGWTEKMVKVEMIDGATNSDKPAGMECTHIVGNVSNRKPDKIYKI